MYNFLGDVKPSTSIVNKDIDPVLTALELGEGLNELNTELIRLDVLNKAKDSLSQSLELDKQLISHSEVNRGTVAYGIESLCMVTNMLGVPMSFDTVAAGIEDNDQSGASNEKKGWMSKIGDAIKKAWEKILNFISTLIEKVKKFFSGETTKKQEEKLEKAAEETEKAEGSDSKKPSCKDQDKAKEIKEEITGLYPIYLEYNGLKSYDDLKGLLDFVVDKNGLENMKYMKEFVSKAGVDNLKILEEMSKDLDETDKKEAKDLSKLKKEMIKIVDNIFNSLDISKFKQHPIKDKFIKDYEDDILNDLKNIGINIKDNKSDYDYKILYTHGHNNGKSPYINIIIVFKNKHTLNSIKNFINTLTSVEGMSKLENKIKHSIGVEIISIKPVYSNKTILKNIEPFPASDLKKLKEKLKDIDSEFKDYLDGYNNEFKTIKEDFNKIIKTKYTQAHNFLNIKNASEAILNGVLTAISSDIKSCTTNITKNFKSIIEHIIQLNRACIGASTSDSAI